MEFQNSAEVWMDAGSTYPVLGWDHNPWRPDAPGDKGPDRHSFYCVGGYVRPQISIFNNPLIIDLPPLCPLSECIKGKTPNRPSGYGRITQWEGPAPCHPGTSGSSQILLECLLFILGQHCLTRSVCWQGILDYRILKKWMKMCVCVHFYQERNISSYMNVFHCELQVLEHCAF